MGTPIIFLYNETSILQLTFGMYATMGINFTCCVAYDSASFITKALYMTNNAIYRKQIKNSILINNFKLFENNNVLTEWQNMLLLVNALPRPQPFAYDRNKKYCERENWIQEREDTVEYNEAVLNEGERNVRFMQRSCYYSDAMRLSSSRFIYSQDGISVDIQVPLADLLGSGYDCYATVDKTSVDLSNTIDESWALMLKDKEPQSLLLSRGFFIDDDNLINIKVSLY